MGDTLGSNEQLSRVYESASLRVYRVQKFTGDQTHRSAGRQWISLGCDMTGGPVKVAGIPIYKGLMKAARARRGEARQGTER